MAVRAVVDADAIGTADTAVAVGADMTVRSRRLAIFLRAGTPQVEAGTARVAGKPAEKRNTTRGSTWD